MTNRQKIINFLQSNPEWVDAYRLTNPRHWILLGWHDYYCEPYFIAAHLSMPLSSGGEDQFTIAPVWRPLPEPETFELDMIEGLVNNSSFGGSRLPRSLRADSRFAGHRVEVTVKAIR